MKQLKKLQEVLTTYKTLKFSKEHERDWLNQKKRELKDFAVFFFSHSKHSGSSIEIESGKKVRTGNYARSLVDFLLHCHHYFPNSSYLDIFYILFFEYPLHFSYCGDVRRLVSAGNLTNPIYRKGPIKISWKISDIFIDELFNEVKEQKFPIISFLNSKFNEARKVIIKDDLKGSFKDIKPREVKKFIKTFLSTCNNSNSTIYKESKELVDCGGDNRSLIDTYNCYKNLFKSRSMAFESFIFELYKSGYSIFRCDDIEREVIYFADFETAGKHYDIGADYDDFESNGWELMKELKKYLIDV